MRLVFIVAEVPDDATKLDIATDLAGVHPYLADPTVYDSLEDVRDDFLHRRGIFGERILHRRRGIFGDR